jgi:hypothetical protein
MNDSVDDISIDEPQKLKHTHAEDLELEDNFLKLIHRFLLAYLTLHNFVIPFIVNAVRGEPLLSDVHFWFLYQFLLHWVLIKRSPNQKKFVIFGLAGSIFRVLFEFLMMTKYGLSWGIFSVVLSEGASFIFFAYYFLRYINKEDTLTHKPIHPFFYAYLVFAFAAQVGIHQVEIRGAIFNVKKMTKRTYVTRDYTKYGCQGSQVRINTTQVERYLTEPVGEIVDCGFTKNFYFLTKNTFLLGNSRDKQSNLRLFYLKKDKWVFKQLFILKPGEQIGLDDLNESPVYMIKSLEQRDIGMLLLFMPGIQTSQYAGTYDFNPAKVEKK